MSAKPPNIASAHREAPRACYERFTRGRPRIRTWPRISIVGSLLTVAMSIRDNSGTRSSAWHPSPRQLRLMCRWQGGGLLALLPTGRYGGMRLHGIRVADRSGARSGGRLPPRTLLSPPREVISPAPLWCVPPILIARSSAACGRHVV